MCCCRIADQVTIGDITSLGKHIHLKMMFLDFVVCEPEDKLLNIDRLCVQVSDWLVRKKFQTQWVTACYLNNT